MKGFKCKIWDKATSTMWLPEDSNHIKIFPNGTVSINGTWSTDDVELLMYTGLKDKNGKCVYEGDILQPEFNKIKRYAHCVVYEDGGFVLGGPGVHSALHLSLLAGKKANNQYAVIGDIYQQPELLQEKNNAN